MRAITLNLLLMNHLDYHPRNARDFADVWARVLLCCAVAVVLWLLRRAAATGLQAAVSNRLFWSRRTGEQRKKKKIFPKSCHVITDTLNLNKSFECRPRRFRWEKNSCALRLFRNFFSVRSTTDSKIMKQISAHTLSSTEEETKRLARRYAVLTRGWARGPPVLQCYTNYCICAWFLSDRVALQAWPWLSWLDCRVPLGDHHGSQVWLTASSVLQLESIKRKENKRDGERSGQCWLNIQLRALVSSSHLVVWCSLTNHNHECKCEIFAVWRYVQRPFKD